MFTLPKNNERFSWTMHIKNKMLYYHISQAQINRIFRNPERVEEGIAPNTIAAMRTKKKNRSATSKQAGPDQEELWIMYVINQGKKKKSILDKEEIKRGRITMISAWRYPGKTKEGERPEIPDDVFIELKAEGLI